MDFPRSGSKPSKNEEENVDEKQFQNNDDMLFNQIEENDMEDEKDEKSTHLKKKAPFQTILVDKSIFNVGSYVLGVISRIEELGLLVELPNGNFGRVSPVEISEPLTELYTKISNNELPESSMPSLNKLFKLGDYVRCIILNVENKTKLSLRPTYLNSHLNIKSIKKGYVLFGCIKSIEDHGYNLSFGEDLDLVGFLSNQNTPLKFQVGQLLSVTVLKMNKESNVVTVSCIPTELDNYKLSTSHVDSLSMILPGDRVACTVVKVIKKGLYVSFLGDIAGTVSIDHLNKVVNPKNISEFYGEGKKFRGKIIFLDHSSKKIGISFNKDIVTGRVSTFAGLSIGDTIEQSTVITVSNKNLLLSHAVAIDGRKNPKNMLITVPNSEISDKKKYGNEQLRKKFETGDKIRVRIKQFRMFGGFILGCTRKSFFARKHINIKSFVPGDIVQGKVDAVQPYMRILLGDTSKFFGMCLKNYLSDSKASKTDTWKDKTLKVRIISNINGIINVTIRESILSDKLPIISSVESIKVGMVTLGVITKVSENGCYVSFYQGFYGFVPTKYLNEDLVNPSSFYVGQTKRTYIISSNLEEGSEIPKLLCSFIDLSKSGILSYKPGQVVEATLKELTSKKTIIANVGSVLAKIDKYQISDFEVDNKVIEELVKKNPKVEAVVLNNSRDRDYLLISLKNSLVEAAKRGQLPINKDLELGKIVVGSINAVDEKFVFLEFADDVNGRLHRRQMFQFENPSDSLQSQFFVGAPIMGLVESKNNKGYSLSIEPNKLYSATNFHDHTFLINSYFNETGLFYSKRFEAIKGLSIGDIIDCKVVSVSEEETILSYSKASSFKFVLLNDLTKDKKELSPNKTVQVRVIDIDIKNSSVDVSNLGYVMKKTKTAPNLQSFTSKFKKVNLRVLLIKTEYTVVFHKKCGVVGFCPSKQLNHLSNGESPAFQNFQKMQAFYERVIEEGTLSRVLFSPFFEATEINESVVDPSEVKIGDVVSGEITKINDFHLSVKIRLSGKRFVRGYISLNEVVDEVKGKTQNLAETFKIGQVLPKIKVINATYQVQEENKANRLCYFLSVRPSRIVLDAPEIGEPIIDVEGLQVGQKLVGYVRKVDGDVSVGIGKNIIGNIPHSVFALDSEVSKNLSKHYFPGIILNVIVEKTGKHPVLIPVEYKDLLQKKPKVGDIVTGTVTDISQNDLRVMVKVDNFPASIHFTEMYDDFTDCQYKSGDEVKAIVLYSGEFLLLSTRPSRMDKSIVPKYPPVEAMSPAKARDQLVAGQTLQGYIKAFYKMNGNVKVAVNGALFGFFIDSGNKREFYKTGKAILVKVKKINESQLVLDKVEIINYVENNSSNTPNKNKRNSTNENNSTIENNTVKKVPISESTVILQTGEDIEVEVLHIQKFGLILRLKEDPRIVGVCYANNIEGNVGTEFHKNYKAGDSLKVKILHVNYEQNQLKFSIGDISGNKPVQKKEFFNWQDVKEDHKYKALVEKIIPDMGLVLKLKKNFFVTGLCHFNEIVDDSNIKNAKSMLNNFQIGDYVKVYVLSVDPEKKKMKLSIKPSYFTKDDEEPYDSEDMDDEDSKKKRKFEEKAEKKEKKSEETKRAKIVVPQPKTEQDDMESEDYSDSEEEDESKPTDGLSAGSFNFFGSGKSDFVYNQDDSQEDNKKAVSEDDDEQNEQFHIDKNLTKKKKKEQKKEKEMEIREIEKNISEGKNKLESAQDFEKLLLSSPNSSLLWIKYMAFQLHLSEIGKAREIAERALKRIDFREENEKKNVWIAYLNLEFKFGGEQSLQSVFKRATMYNESLNIHLELVNIYIRNGQNEKAEELFKKMLKKFKVHSNVWTKYALFLVQNQRGDEVKKVIDRALLVLPKYKHVLTLSKFAIIEFQHGSVDTGRTIFESILNNFPKRTDILNVYINQEKKLKELDRVRNLYERAINMKNSVRQMKFFFKNYLKFEQKNGDLERVEQVKKKAYDYVNS